jgi:vitamin B12 transporter
VSSRKDFDGYDTPTFALGDDGEYAKNEQSLVYAGLTEHSASQVFTNRIAVQYTHSDTRNYDPQAPVNYGSTTTETFFGIGSNTREEYQGIWQLAPTAHLTYGVQHERSEIDTDTPAFDVTPMPLLADATIDSAYAQWQGEVAEGLTLTAGERLDHHNVYGGHATGQLAAAWLLNDKQTVLRASVGQGFKAPSLYQLFSNYGNRALQPEQSVSWDAGLEKHLMQDQLILSATYFQSRSHDLIDFFDCSTPSPLCTTEPYGYYANIAAATSRGVEGQAVWSVNAHNTLTANFTYANALDAAEGSSGYGNVLPRRPKQTGNISDHHRWTDAFSSTVAVRYAGRSYDDAANTIVLGGYVLTDVRVSYALSKSVDLYARIENLTDKHYETAYQYGTLGRVGYLGVHANF